MNFSYIVTIDGVDIMQECSYHTREVLADGTERRVYPRSHNAKGPVALRLISDYDPKFGVHHCTLKIQNDTDHEVRISRADIGIAFDSKKTMLHYFSSDWGSEYSPCVKEIDGEFSYGVIAGRSCKGFIPYAECHGDEGVYALALGWSGNWTCTTFPWPASYCCNKPWTYCCIMGLTDGAFYHDIPAGKSFTTPVVYITKADGREQANLNLRRYYRARLSIVYNDQFSPMPTAYNGWWPYEDHSINEEVYQKNAEIAKALGCRYAVLDAGWFGKTADGQCWFEKRGDWDCVNEDIFPSGMRAMCDRAKETEILPGIWCEIEAIGKDARLNETRDDIIAKRNGRSLGYVCFGSEQGYEWAMEVMDRIIGEYGAKWVKIDFNLDPGMGCNRTDHNHGAGDGLYAHYINYYRFLDELHRKYPDVVLENCSSGGLRGDIGMMSHCHWNFLSDPDFTELQLQLYWGGLSFLHQSALLHFSWSEVVQDHNCGIFNPIREDMSKERFDFMIRAALMGVPGFSYKLPEMPRWCKERLSELIAFFTETSEEFILNGDAYRLTEQPLAGGQGERFPAFAFVNGKQEALVYAFRLPGSPAGKTFMIPALDGEAAYNVQFIDEGRTETWRGTDLAEKGIELNGMAEESSAAVLIRKLDEGASCVTIPPQCEEV